MTNLAIVQGTFNPGALAQDKIFFTALLTGAADVTVTIGGVSVAASWRNTPPGPAGSPGMYHGTASFGSNTGTVVVRIARSGVL